MKLGGITKKCLRGDYPLRNLSGAQMEALKGDDKTVNHNFVGFCNFAASLNTKASSRA